MLPAVDVGVFRAAGWRPVDLVYEHQRYGGHGGWVSLHGGRMNPLNYTAQELVAASTVTTFAGTQTRQRMQSGLPPGGGMILSSYDVATDVEECAAVDGYTDFVVDVQAVGTTVAPVTAPRGPRPAGLQITPVVGLGDRCV